MRIRMARQIRDADSASIVSQLLFLEAEEASKPIHLYINSPGAGLSVCGSRLHQTIQSVIRWQRDCGVGDLRHGESLADGRGVCT